MAFLESDSVKTSYHSQSKTLTIAVKSGSSFVIHTKAGALSPSLDGRGCNFQSNSSDATNVAAANSILSSKLNSALQRYYTLLHAGSMVDTEPTEAEKKEAAALKAKMEVGVRACLESGSKEIAGKLETFGGNNPKIKREFFPQPPALDPSGDTSDRSATGAH